MDINRLVFNRLDENTYIISGAPGRCVIVDPGCEPGPEQDKMLGRIRELGLTPEAILLTHGHMDHTYGVAALQKEFGIPVYMSADDKAVVEYFQRVAKFGIPVPDPSFVTTDVTDDMTIEAAGLKFKVITTPGHSPGCVCYYDEEHKVLFTGDTLFAGAIGRSDLFGGDYDVEIRSIMEKLMLLDGDVSVLPGHGPSTTIGNERVGNPFLEPFNEREEIPELNESIYD